MNVVDFQEIHHGYQRGLDVLKGVSFSIGAGEVVGLLGQNGAGKTTLMHLAMGMLEPLQGSVRLFGLDPRRQSLEVKRRIGFVSEDQLLPPFLRRAHRVHGGDFARFAETAYRRSLFGDPGRPSGLSP